MFIHLSLSIYIYIYISVYIKKTTNVSEVQALTFAPRRGRTATKTQIRVLTSHSFYYVKPLACMYITKIFLHIRFGHV